MRFKIPLIFFALLTICGCFNQQHSGQTKNGSDKTSIIKMSDHPLTFRQDKPAKKKRFRFFQKKSIENPKLDSLFTKCLDTLLSVVSGESSKIRITINISYPLDNDSNQVYKNLTEFNSSGLIKRSFSVYLDTLIYNSDMRTDYIYDSLGRISKITNHFNSFTDDEFSKNEMEHFYNGKHLDYVIQRFYLLQEIKDTQKLKCETDSLGNILKDYSYCWVSTYYEYDTLNRMVDFNGFELSLHYIYKDNYKYQEIYEYGDKSITTYNKEGLEISKECYDDSPEDILLRTLFYTYKFDRRGNWIKKYETLNRKTRLLEEREIIYF